MGEESQKVQTFSSKISHGDVMYSLAIIVNTVLHNWKLLRVDLKSFHHEKFCNYVMIDVKTRLIVIISQYI